MDYVEPCLLCASVSVETVLGFRVGGAKLIKNCECLTTQGHFTWIGPLRFKPGSTARSSEATKSILPELFGVRAVGRGAGGRDGGRREGLEGGRAEGGRGRECLPIFIKNFPCSFVSRTLAVAPGFRFRAWGSCCRSVVSESGYFTYRLQSG